MISADAQFVAFLSNASNVSGSSTSQTLVVGGVDVEPHQASHPSSESIGSIDVTFVYPGTEWAAVSHDPWIVVDSQSSTDGNGNVSYTVAANSTTDVRVGTLTVAGQTVTIAQDAAPADFVLTVTMAGTGSGTVTSVPSGISCPDTCSQTFPADIVVTLDATPAVGSAFTGWGGACAGTADCTVAMDGAKDVTATFTLAGIDLAESNAAVAETSVAPGGKLTISDTVDNIGTQPAGSFAIRYYLSVDTVKNAGDILLTGSRSIAGLAAGDTSTGPRLVTVPSATAFGGYYVIACADDLRRIAETDETNNCVSTETTVTVGRPDLITSSLTDPPAQAIPGGKFLVTDTVSNVGNVTAAASTTRYYLSTDQLKDAADLLLTGLRNVLALEPGDDSSAGVTVTIPASTPLASYYLVSCADVAAKVVEINEANNCRASTATILIGLPDLVTTALSAPPATSRPGGRFTLNSTVHNQGNIDATASSLRFYLSIDTSKGAGDVLLTGNRAIPILVPGGDSTANKQLTIPSATASGTYFVVACADDLAKVAESDETNNCLASGSTVTISP